MEIRVVIHQLLKRFQQVNESIIHRGQRFRVFGRLGGKASDNGFFRCLAESDYGALGSDVRGQSCRNLRARIPAFVREEFPVLDFSVLVQDVQ